MYKRQAFNTFAASYDLVHWTDWKGADLIIPSKDYDELFAHKSYVAVSYTHLDVYKRQHIGRTGEAHEQEHVAHGTLAFVSCLLYTSRCV